MNPWKRPTDRSGTEFERLLIDSARDDAAPLASRRHVAARLGVDLARIDAGPALTRSATASDAVSLTRAGLEPASAGALVKCTLIAVIGGLSAVGTVSEREAVEAPMVPEARIAAVVPPAMPATLIEPTAPAAPTASEMRAKSAELPDRARQPARRAPRPAAPPRRELAGNSDVEASVTDPLLLEVEQLDRARSALGSGRNLEALRALDEYDVRFPRGSLVLEATLLRIRTFERAGRFAHAAGLARRALELPGSERYRSELARVAGGEDTALDKSEHPSTLEGAR